MSIDPQCMQEMIVTCVSKVDNYRCLLGGSNGKVHMLFLETEEKMEECEAARSLEPAKRQMVSVSNLRLELLGEVRKTEPRV